MYSANVSISRDVCIFVVLQKEEREKKHAEKINLHEKFKNKMNK